MSKNSQAVMRWRRRQKQKLVDHHGGACVDCGYTGPAFMFDFDHRDPTQKSFGLSGTKQTSAYSKLLAESLKCDLVCANCHRFRTHKQRCEGCEHC